ncbi:formate/nitrite transporter family protein, partial [Nostoc sp. NIES-2111]
ASARTAVSSPYGVMRLLSGLVFSLGLILVVVGGAELFTGNNLIVMAWASGRVRTRDLLRNWALAFVGNAAGAGATAVLMVLTGQYMFGGGAVGLSALNIAAGKAALGPASAFSLGIMCNALVCLAVWMSYSARTTADRILCVVPPVAAFVAAGFEHSIANIYFLAVALLIKSLAPPAFWTAIGHDAADFDAITWRAAFVDNLLPVTAGNVVGGAVLVAGVYWFIYLRNRPKDIGGRV